MKAKALAAPGPVVGSRLTVRLPIDMIDEVKRDMEKHEYGRRQQSRWISEAIDRLLTMDYFPELVAEDYIADGRNKPVRISVPGTTSAGIDRAVPRVRRELKTEEVISKLVRTAIIQRLIATEISEGGDVGR